VSTELLSYPESEVPPAWNARRLALHEQAWPGSDGSGHDPALAPLSLLLVQDGELVATLDLLSKELEHRGRTYRASGLSAVVTATEHRGRGLGGTLVRAARQRLQALERDLAIFSCDRPLAGFYERAGFARLPGAVLVGGTRARPLPSDGLGKVVLAAWFSPLARSHAAEFAGARVELYPGDIDRLW
jgi:aminoglycoside 2'-N-acetyltransferase I